MDSFIPVFFAQQTSSYHVSLSQWKEYPRKNEEENAIINTHRHNRATTYTSGRG